MAANKPAKAASGASPPMQSPKPPQRAAARHKPDHKSGHAPALAAGDNGAMTETGVAGRAMHKSVGWALTVLARLHRVELGERLAGLGLFPGQEQLLQALHDHETMTMGALSELMRVRPPTASKAVGRLSAQGLVERVDSGAGDGRLVRVRLTSEGRVRAGEVAGIWQEAEQRLLDGFDPRERKKLRKFLRRSAENFIGATEASAPEPADDNGAGTDRPSRAS